MLWPPEGQLIPPNSDCHWYFRSTSPQRSFQIAANFMDIPNPSPSCNSGDYLELRNDGPFGELIGRYCGNSSFTASSVSNLVYARLRSGSRASNGHGFSLSVFIHYNNCGGTIEAPASFSSPGFPDAFPYHRRCTWTLAIPIGRKARLEFERFNLKANPRNASECLDKLYYRYPHMYENMYQIGCSAGTPEPLELTAAYVMLQFETQGLAASEGFTINYSTDDNIDCGGVIDTSSKPDDIIQSPAILNSSLINSNRSENCLWVMNVDERTNYTHGIEFTVLEIAGRAPRNGYGSCEGGNLQLGYNFDRYGHTEVYFCGNDTMYDIDRRIVFNRQWKAMWLILRMNYTDGMRGVQ